MPNRLLDDLDAAQQKAASATTGRVAILAVAGAGKTRTITHRIAYAIATEAQTANTGLAISYTTKSAAELKNRLSQLGVNDFATATIHGAAWRQLKHFWPKALGGKPWQLVTNRTRTFEAAAERAGLSYATAELRTLQSEIERLKAMGLDPDLHRELVPNVDAALTELWQRYSEYCSTSRLIDFDDMLQLLIGVLQNRPDALQEVQNRYRWFTVDEYQDITPLQNQLLNVWLGQSNEICVVGDPTQSIYEFAGAVPNLLREFVAQPNTQLISLNRSYRLAQEIANVANPIAGWLGEQTLLSDRVGGLVSVTPFANQEAEVHGVVSQIKGLNANGISFGSMAVLLRTGAQVNEFATALERENIPIVTRAASRFIDSNLVKHALLALKAGGDSSAITVSEAVIAVAQGLGWRDVWADATIALNDWLGLSSLVQLSKTEVASVNEFLDVVGDRVLAAAEPPADAISILTIHQAKGLEWDCVFLPRFNEVQGMHEPDLVAEARVQFVAVTRARYEVRISFAESDKFGRALELSRFVSQDLPAAPKLSLEFVTAVSPVQVREPVEQIFCESCAAALRAPIEIMTRLCAECVPAPNSELRDKLLGIRSILASERDVPNWALVSDAAIEALAIRPPASTAELRHFPALQRLSDKELEAFQNLWH